MGSGYVHGDAMPLRTLRWAAVVVIALGSSIAFAQDYEAFEGTNNAFEGEGGTKRVVDGVEFWTNGSPPTKFMLLGFVTDRRHRTGLVGRIRMSSLESDVAQKVREAGGDAVVLLDSSAETIGVVGNSNTSSSANAHTFGSFGTASGRSRTTTTARAVQKQVSRFAVIRYLPSEVQSPGNTSTDPAAPHADAPASSAPPSAGCTKDVDCKGTRVCERGMCVEPSTMPNQ
jgi:hypothetical protein